MIPSHILVVGLINVIRYTLRLCDTGSTSHSLTKGGTLADSSLGSGSISLRNSAMLGTKALKIRQAGYRERRCMRTGSFQREVYCSPSWMPSATKSRLSRARTRALSLHASKSWSASLLRKDLCMLLSSATKRQQNPHPLYPFQIATIRNFDGQRVTQIMVKKGVSDKVTAHPLAQPSCI